MKDCIRVSKHGCTRVGAAGLRSPLGATQTSKHRCFILAVAVLTQRQSSLLMLSGPGYAEIRDRDIPEDTPCRVQ